MISAERLQALRHAQGLTLDELAARSGVSRAMISRVERAEASPTAALLARLCEALGLSLSAFFADEENGSVWGAQWLSENHPELFAGMTEAISEVGGYSITLPDQSTGEDVRAYLVQTAEKGLAWGRLRATGRAGHGSVPNDENAIVRLAEAISRIAAMAPARSPVRLGTRWLVRALSRCACGSAGAGRSMRRAGSSG